MYYKSDWEVMFYNYGVLFMLYMFEDYMFWFCCWWYLIFLGGIYIVIDKVKDCGFMYI